MADKATTENTEDWFPVATSPAEQLFLLPLPFTPVKICPVCCSRGTEEYTFQSKYIVRLTSRYMVTRDYLTTLLLCSDCFKKELRLWFLQFAGGCAVMFVAVLIATVAALVYFHDNSSYFGDYLFRSLLVGVLGGVFWGSILIVIYICVVERKGFLGRYINYRWIHDGLPSNTSEYLQLRFKSKSYALAVFLVNPHLLGHGFDGIIAWYRSSLEKASSARDLQLNFQLKDLSDTASGAKGWIAVTAVDNVLRFRKFDCDDELVADIYEKATPFWADFAAEQAESFSRRFSEIVSVNKTAWATLSSDSEALNQAVDLLAGYQDLTVFVEQVNTAQERDGDGNRDRVNSPSGEAELL
jgi:hypothetical protein